MLIPCSEKCIYEKDGLCSLKNVIPSSDTPIKDCPYFTGKEEKEKKKGAP